MTYLHNSEALIGLILPFAICINVILLILGYWHLSTNLLNNKKIIKNIAEDIKLEIDNKLMDCLQEEVSAKFFYYNSWNAIFCCLKSPIRRIIGEKIKKSIVDGKH